MLVLTDPYYLLCIPVMHGCCRCGVIGLWLTFDPGLTLSTCVVPVIPFTWVTCWVCVWLWVTQAGGLAVLFLLTALRLQLTCSCGCGCLATVGMCSMLVLYASSCWVDMMRVSYRGLSCAGVAWMMVASRAISQLVLLCALLTCLSYLVCAWCGRCTVGNGSEHRGTARQEVDVLQRNPLRCSRQIACCHSVAYIQLAPFGLCELLLPLRPCLR